MEILRDFSQIATKVEKVFGVDVSSVQILDPISLTDIKKLMEGAKKCENNTTAVVELSELIFQLNEYLPALCNFIKMLLVSKNYAGVIAFMEKTFVAHVGTSNYVSKNKVYSLKERFFDRFIEVVKSTDLNLIDILPFLFKIVEDNNKTVLSDWQAPTFEYLQGVFRENMPVVKDFVAINSAHQETYYFLGLEFNTQLALAEIFKDENSLQNEAIFGKMLKHYYTDTMAFFDKNLDQAGAQKFHYVKILSSIEKPEVTARLENLYEEETDPEIKAYIKNKLGIAEQVKVGISPKHFQTMALKKVENAQERSLGVAFENLVLHFENGEGATNTDKTHLINTFKEQKDLKDLPTLLEIEKLFDKDELQNFVRGIFGGLKKLDDIKQAKWAIRMIALLADGELEQNVYEYVENLFVTKRNKEAKYFLLCLIYSKKNKVINLIQKLIEENNQAFNEVKNEYVELYASCVAKNVDDVHEMLALDTQITDEALAVQKERLYASFIANKSYTRETFEEIFIGKKVFNILAQNLVFGEYKQNRIVSLFVLEGTNKKYIGGTDACADMDVIKIAHSLDLDERYEEIKQKYTNQTFKQFSNQVYAYKDNEKTQSRVASMQGVLINSIKFVTKMQNYGFVKNVANETDDTYELLHISTDLGLLAEVSFESPVSNYSSTSSLGEIRFYKLNQCLKNGSVYIINKANSISLGGVEPRYYDYVVGSVSKALKN